jgi:hypothetical protein
MANLVTAGRAYPKTLQAIASSGIGLPTDVTTTNTQPTISLADAQRRFGGRGQARARTTPPRRRGGGQGWSLRRRPSQYGAPPQGRGQV